jgi:hypothetical protein
MLEDLATQHYDATVQAQQKAAEGMQTVGDGHAVAVEEASMHAAWRQPHAANTLCPERMLPSKQE